ncbi:hypothetical protein HK105_205491 [Polyrhizophydium stewartii]|uniref:Methyltransferase-like protein 5 n=1 Tax=Polyrhizophydium stewartii TaxID=2732419 RepID=A0ABR4N5Y4_9FUNG|nr:hypothetical protein HK105_003180 [Polyrhizophydium stewartii]
MIKLKQLESELTQVTKFREPKVQLEQYPTTAHLAASMLYTAATTYEDIEDASVVDLGVGCGMLTCASGILGAAYNVGVDVDPEALEQARDNCDRFELDADLVNLDVQELVVPADDDEHGFRLTQRLSADTVVMNPPFGTKSNKGIDMVFLQAAAGIAERAIYSLHKTSTRDFILRKAQSWGLKGEVVAELRYNIEASYKFHKKKSVDVEVDFLRFEVE